MGLFFWKKNKLIDGFATSLADEFYSSLPVEMLEDYLSDKKNKSDNKKSEKKTSRKVDTLIAGSVTQMKQFISEHSLGIYGKARIHMKFTEQLTELGYPEEIANSLNKSIMLKIPN